MKARMEVTAEPDSIERLKDEFEPVEEESDTEIVLEDDMGDVFNFCREFDIPTDAWVVEPKVDA